MRLLALLVFLATCLVLSSSKPAFDEVRLSDVSVLLPYNNKVSHVIEAFNGCFEWRALNPAVVHLEVLDDCGRRVRVRAHSESSFSRRESTWLTATEKSTKRMLRCELFVDRVSKLEVLTTTRTMYKDDIERFDIQAFDSAGNKFSSIEGLIFEWGIQQTKTQHAATSILKFVPFKDSGIEATELLKTIEDDGKQSTAVLVRGIQTGRVLVSARLTDYRAAVGESQLEAKVEISVLEPLQLDPAHNIYVAPNTPVPFLLKTFKRNQLIPINMPNVKYSWNSVNTSVATISNSGLAHAKNMGATIISCSSVDLPENEASTNFYVVPPSYLVIEITEIDESINSSMVRVPNAHNFYLVLGRPYLVNIAVYDADNHRFHSTEGLDFSVGMTQSHLQIIKNQITPNKSQLNLTSLDIGDCEIEASLNFNGRTISAKQNIYVVRPVEISPNERILLPLDSLYKHTYQLAATGGSGGYVWSSSHGQRVVVGAQGMVKGESEGVAIVRVHDLNNPNNYDQTEVTVAPPNKIAFVNGYLEVPVGDVLHTGAILFDATPSAFTNCSALPLVWEVNDRNVFEIEPLDLEVPDAATLAQSGSCGVLRLKALREGTTTVTVKYANLKVSTLVAAYTPLALSHDRVVLTLGSSFTVTSLGGPSAWPHDTSKFVEEVIANKEAVSVSEPKRAPASGEHAAWRQYEVTCKQHGEYTVIFRVGNLVSLSNPKPRVAEVELSLICSPPHSIFIHPFGADFAADTPKTCAEAMENAVLSRGSSSVDKVGTIYRLRSDRRLPFNLLVFNADGLLFHNFSTVLVDWKSLDSNLIQVGEGNAPQSIPSGRFGNGALQLRTRDLIVSLAHEKTARLELSALQYDPEALKALGITFVHWPPIKKAFSFVLYERLSLPSDRYSVYLHEANRVNVRPAYGSGDFSISVNSTSVANVSKVAPAGSLPYFGINPLTEGVVSVTLSDRCLPSDTARTTVFVSDLHAIRLRARDALEVGHKIALHVYVLDRFGNFFPDDQFKWFPLDSRIDNTAILAATPSVGENASPSRLVLSGLSVGFSTITVTAESQSGAQVSSEPLGVYVYPTFKLIPPRLVLVPGATFQLQWQGAIPSMSEVSFSLPPNASSILDVDPITGRVRALSPGKVDVAGSALKEDAMAKEKFLVGRSTTEISVRPLKAIRIAASTNRMLVGGVQTLQVIGFQPDEVPFSWGNLDIKFEWSASLSSAIALKPIYANAQISLDQEASFAVRVNAVAPGRATVKVTILSAPPATHLQGLEASLVLDIVEPLRLLTPSELLLAPGSHFTIKTNYAAVQKRLFYQTLESSSPNPQKKANASSIISVSDEGRITASHTAGTAFLHISDSPLDPTSLSQSVVVKVVVKPVQQIGLSPSVPASFHLPVGAEQEFKVSLRDELGLEFHAYDSIDFETLLNVLDVASVTLRRGEGEEEGKASLLVLGLAPGRAIARVQTASDVSESRLATYLQLDVSNAIVPQSVRVHKGGQVTFQARFTYDIQAYRNPWSTSNPTVLSVDGATGLTTALSTGSALVYHNSSVQTHASVHVVELTRVDVLPQQASFTGSGLLISIPIRYFSGSEELLDTPDLQHNIKLSCSSASASAAFPFNTLPSPKSTATRPALCALSLKLKNNETLSQVLLSSRKPFEVELKAAEIQKKVTVDLSALFFPASSVLEITDDPSFLPIKWLTAAHPDLHVDTSAPELDVRVLREKQNETHSIYRVALLLGRDQTPRASSYTFTLRHPLTNQSSLIQVHYSPGRRLAADAQEESYSFVFLFFMALLALGIASFVVYGAFVLRYRLETPPPPPGSKQAPPPTPLVPMTPNIYRGKNYAPPTQPQPAATPRALFSPSYSAVPPPTPSQSLFGSPSPSPYTQPLMRRTVTSQAAGGAPDPFARLGQ